MAIPSWLERPASDSPWVINPNAEKAIWFIYMHALDGLGLNAIVNALDREQIQTFGPRRTTWDERAVEALLKNRAICGYSGATRGVYPAVIPEALWNMIQKRASPIGGRRPRHNGTSTSGNWNPFTGLLTCGVCESKLRFRGFGGHDGTIECPHCDLPTVQLEKLRIALLPRAPLLKAWDYPQLVPDHPDHRAAFQSQMRKTFRGLSVYKDRVVATMSDGELVHVSLD